MLSISILHINDNLPVFDKNGEYLAKNNESVETGSYVTQVSAEDKDHGENSRISYLLLPKSEISNQFNIDEETGVITVNNVLLLLEK